MVEMSVTKMIVGRSIGTVMLPELPDRRGAVDRGRLVEVLRDRLQRGQEDQRVVAGPAPVDHRRDREPRRPAVLLPVDRVDADEAEQPVDQAEVPGEQQREDDADRGDRGDVRAAARPSARSVRARSRWLSSWARTSASSSCGTVASTKMPRVLTSAFQKSSSRSSSRVVVQADPACGRPAGSSRAARPRRCTASGNSPKMREEDEERRDERVAAATVSRRCRPRLAAARGRERVHAGRCSLAGGQARSDVVADGGGRRRRGPAARRAEPSRSGRLSLPRPSASSTAVGPALVGGLLAALDAAEGVLDRVAHRLVLGAEVDRLEAARTGDEDLADRGVAEVRVRRVLDGRVVVERRVGRQVADRLERRELAVGAGQELGQLDGQSWCLLAVGHRQERAAPVAAAAGHRWRCPTCRRCPSPACSLM